MARDWESYRRDFIVHLTDYTYSLLRAVENIESPIERIAVVETIKFRDVYGSANFSVSSHTPVGKYEADIVIRNKSIKVAIECDGHEFHEKTKEQAAKDKKRDREFQKEGYVILRYTGSEICNNPKTITDDLKKIFNVDVVTTEEG